MTNSLDPEMAQHFGEPDLGSNSLQRLSADGTCMYWIIYLNCIHQPNTSGL